MIACHDPNHEGNSAKYHTGKPCIEHGCTNPAGTAWSPLWCFQHNSERIRRISRSMETIARTFTTEGD